MGEASKKAGTLKMAGGENGGKKRRASTCKYYATSSSCDAFAKDISNFCNFARRSCCKLLQVWSTKARTKSTMLCSSSAETDGKVINQRHSLLNSMGSSKSGVEFTTRASTLDGSLNHNNCIINLSGLYSPYSSSFFPSTI